MNKALLFVCLVLSCVSVELYLQVKRERERGDNHYSSLSQCTADLSASRAVLEEKRLSEARAAASDKEEEPEAESSKEMHDFLERYQEQFRNLQQNPIPGWHLEPSQQWEIDTTNDDT